MGLVAQSLPYIEISLGIMLILTILLQQTSAGIGGALGGGDTASFQHVRRGFEKFLFYFSIVCGTLFALFALLAIILNAKA
jgi:protein translocase SecG subunit